MTATITKLKTQIQTSQKRKPRINHHFQKRSAVAIGLVASVLTALSLSHLAHGIEIVTASPTWEAWAMAIGIDLSFVVLELAGLVRLADPVRKTIQKYLTPSIIGTLVGSAILNAFAFAAQASGTMMQVAAIVIGVAIPALIYALTRIGATLYIDYSSRI